MSDSEQSPRLSAVPFKPWPIKPANAKVERRKDGSILVRSNHAPGAAPQSIAHLIQEKARAHPDRPLLKERSKGEGPWRVLTYGEAIGKARRFAVHLARKGLGPNDSVLILSENSIEHALVTFGCYFANVPAAPISPGLSLLSSDHARLRHCFNVLRPRVVFAQCAKRFSMAFKALASIDPKIEFIAVENAVEGVVPLGELIAQRFGEEALSDIDHVGAASVAKYLFTSGSTGVPKAVPQTHGMMTSVIASLDGLKTQEEDPGFIPRTLEWMPWSHLAAGNINFNLAIAAGGTVHLDDGKPVPGLFDITIRNLREVEPVEFASMPIAYGMLAEAMERDPDLRRAFFRNLRYMSYGGATLSNDVYERIQKLAIAETGYRIPLTTMYGATETQGITMTHWPTERVGLIGLPLPGIELKLVPSGNKLEVRARGRTVMGGYHGDPERTHAAFDEEGFYKLGDAVRFIDEANPNLGLIFDGRVAEDFKLDSGTWVSVGVLRPDIVAACSPYIQDALIAGQDKPYVTALLWPSVTARRQFQGPEGTLRVRDLTAALKPLLAVYNAQCSGSSRRIERFTILAAPPSPDRGEITDKGYINQRVALELHAADVEALYRDPPPEAVIRVTPQQ